MVPDSMTTNGSPVQLELVDHGLIFPVLIVKFIFLPLQALV